MSTNQLQTDFRCSDCNKYFDSASYLLTHFALHATQDKNQVSEETIENDDNKTNEENKVFFCFKSEKKTVPDLYPINMIKTKNDIVENKYFDTQNAYNEDKKELNLSNIIETESDEFNPLKFCTISMDVKNHKKKYPCTFCTKVFGWSTDLKRHILTHTGQRPFKCKYCDATFTRNFLLQKHERKAHQNELDLNISKNKTKIPNLKPICTEVKSKDSRKQDKQKIKRKCIYYATETKNEYCGLLQQQFNIIEKETIVQ